MESGTRRRRRGSLGLGSASSRCREDYLRPGSEGVGLVGELTRRVLVLGREM